MANVIPRQGAAGRLKFLGRFPVTRAKAVKRPRWILTGVTKDSTGAPLGGCLVQMYETTAGTNPVLKAEATSDANGNYTLEGNGPPQPYKLVAYKPGSPDVTGATVNTLTTIDG